MGIPSLGAESRPGSSSSLPSTSGVFGYSHGNASSPDQSSVIFHFYDFCCLLKVYQDYFQSRFQGAKGGTTVRPTGLKGRKSEPVENLPAKMPTRQKTLMYGGAFVTSIASFIIICAVLGTQRWMNSEVRFSGGNSTTTVSLTYGLFQVTCAQVINSGLQISASNFQGKE